MPSRSPGAQSRALSPPGAASDGDAPGGHWGKTAAQPGNRTRNFEPHPSGGGGHCSVPSSAPDGAPAHALDALAPPFSVAAEGDVDTEVVVVAAAPVGAGRGAQSAAGGREDGGVLHLRRRRTRALSVGCESTEPTSGFSAPLLPVGVPGAGTARPASP